MHLSTIAKWELRKTRSSFSKKTLALSLVLLILIGAVSFYVSQSGLHINDNIYRVVITDPALEPVLQTDGRFEVYVREGQEAGYLFDNGFDILIVGRKVFHHDSEKSVSALDALDRAILRYDEARLLSYNDLNNTFPVWITVINVAREQVFPASIQRLPEFGESLEEAPRVTPAIEIQKPEERTPLPSKKELFEMKSISPLKEQALSTPSHFNPPIPFKSVVLSFIFIFPIYFIAQFFSSSIMEERVKRKGELLLASPAKPCQIVFGKLLP